MIKCRRPPPPSRHFSFFLMSFSSSPDHNWFSSTATYWRSPVFIFVLFVHVTSLGSVLSARIWGWSEAMREGCVRKKKESMWKRQNAAFIRKTKKDINNQKTEIFMGKKTFFWRKSGKVIFILYVSFFLFLIFCFLFFFIWSKLERSPQELACCLASGACGGAGGGARSGPRQSLWDIRLLPNSFESKNCLINIGLWELSGGFYIFQAV